MNTDTRITAIPHDSTPLPLRAHTILGVCEALGEDFGINPLWFRVPFGASVLISPLWAVVGYLALGIVVLGSRLIAPNSRTLSATIQETVPANSANDETKLPLAA